MMDPKDRVIHPDPKPGDNLDYALRPKKLSELIGQDPIPRIGRYATDDVAGVDVLDADLDAAFREIRFDSIA